MGARNRSSVRTEVRDGRKVLIVDFRFTDKDGHQRRYRKDASVQTAAGARAEADRLKRLAATRGSLEPEAKAPTFAAFVEGDYARLVLPRLKASTREGYRQLLDAPEHGLLALVGRKRLDAISPADARLVEADALARKARPRYAIVALHSVLKAAVELGALAQAPRLPKLPARSEKLPAAPPLAVVMQSLGAADGWLLVAVALAALGGLRCGEIRAFTAGDVALDAGYLVVRRAYSADELGTPKGRDERRVPLTPALAAILTRACEGKSPTALVVADARGEALSEGAIGAAWRRLQGRLGIEPAWRFHGLRHFFASVCLRSGNVEAVRQLLGHRDLASTSRYTHALAGDLVGRATAPLPRPNPAVVEDSWVAGARSVRRAEAARTEFGEREVTARVRALNGRTNEMGDHPLLLSPEKLAILQKTGDSDVQALVAEVLRLRDDWVRMRSALHVLDQWDQLNPPPPMSDLPWVRKVVDDGLGKTLPATSLDEPR